MSETDLYIPSGTPVTHVALPSATLRLRTGTVLRRQDDQAALAWERAYKREAGSPAAGVWIGGGLRVICSMDPTPAWGPLLHASLSKRDRTYPDWDVIHAIKDAVYGDVDACMVMPRAADYVNLPSHGAVFHLWQTPERWGLQ